MIESLKNNVSVISESLEKYIPLIIFLCGLAIALLAPLKIASTGYTPQDDARRHVAKAVSHRSWNDILVLKHPMKIDYHQGWHDFLQYLSSILGGDQNTLLVNLMALLFALSMMLPFLFFKRPEAWLCAHLIFNSLSPSLYPRLMLARPLILTMSCFMIVFITWEKFKESKTPVKWYCLYTALFTLTFWLHPSWYLVFLVLAAFVLAREFKAGIRIGLCAAVAVILAGILTGSPLYFYNIGLGKVTSVLFGKGISMVDAAASATAYQNLVKELRPAPASPLVLFLIAGFIVFRIATGEKLKKSIDNPVFILFCLSCILGYKVGRFYIDWAIPAALVWVALEIQQICLKHQSPSNLKRMLIAGSASLAMFVIIPTDLAQRWSYNTNVAAPALNTTEPQDRQWFPEDGGIVYASEMDIYYGMFYANPNGNWRYILGHEQKLMPAEDYNIFNHILDNYHALPAYKPWVDKMKSKDRLVIRHPQSNPRVEFPSLEWKQMPPSDWWFGRLK